MSGKPEIANTFGKFFQKALSIAMWAFFSYLLLLSIGYIPLNNSITFAVYLLFCTFSALVIFLSRGIFGETYTLFIVPVFFVVLKFAFINAAPGSYGEYFFGHALWVDSKPTAIGAVLEYGKFLIFVLIYLAVERGVSAFTKSK